MSVSTLFFVIGMILAGGLVALMADKLGRTLGKKRLTLFGLRPRHTATAITVIAGMLIPLATILLFAAISKSVNILLRKGDQLIDDNNRLAKTNNELQNDNKKLDQVNQAKSKDNKMLVIEVQKNSKTLQQRLNELKAVTQHVALLQANVTHLTSETVRLTSDLKTTQSELQTKKSDLLIADKNLSAVTKNLNELTSRYNTLKNSYAVVDKQRQEANDEVRQLQQESSELTQANDALRTANEKAQNDLAKTKSDLEYQKLLLDDARTQLAKAKSDQNYIVNFMNNNVVRTFLTPLTFSIGDELARVTIPAHSDEATVRGLFNNLTKQAVATAIAGGAKPSAQNDAATLFPNSEDVNQQVSPEQYQESIITKATNLDHDVMLVAKCELNSYVAYPVPFDVQQQANPTVYHRNDKIAETMVNGSASEDVIFQKVSDFLTSDVKAKALKDGMIPVAGQEQSFGEVPIWQLVQLSRQIKDSARPVRLAALVDADTRAADTLHLHFRVR